MPKKAENTLHQHDFSGLGICRACGSPAKVSGLVAKIAQETGYSEEMVRSIIAGRRPASAKVHAVISKWQRKFSDEQSS